MLREGQARPRSPFGYMLTIRTGVSQHPTGWRPASPGRPVCRRLGPVRHRRRALVGWRALGLVPSFAGPATYRANGALRDAARAADALLIETDAPYLSPEGHRGGRNEPAFVAVTYRAVAAARGADVSALSATTDAVAGALFGPRW